jgi:exodeoxyribonuclease-3
MMKIVTWNVNSIAVRSPHLTELIQIHNPDVILLQEIKCQNHQFPYELFDDKYQIFVNGQKAYNGVAILVKKELDAKITVDNFDEEFILEARYLEICINQKLLISSVYVPNGQAVETEKFYYKLNFLKKLNEYLTKKAQDYSIIIAGDFNVAPFDVDVKNPDKIRQTLGFHSKEHKEIRAFFNSGFYDPFRLLSQDQCFSWWDYRSGGFQKDDGMRIDYFLISSDLTHKVQEVLHCKDFRAKEKPSDHIPVMLEIG